MIALSHLQQGLCSVCLTSAPLFPDVVFHPLPPLSSLAIYCHPLPHAVFGVEPSLSSTVKSQGQGSLYLCYGLSYHLPDVSLNIFLCNSGTTTHHSSAPQLARTPPSCAAPYTAPGMAASCGCPCDAIGGAAVFTLALCLRRALALYLADFPGHFLRLLHFNILGLGSQIFS